MPKKMNMHVNQFFSVCPRLCAIIFLFANFALAGEATGEGDATDSGVPPVNRFYEELENNKDMLTNEYLSKSYKARSYLNKLSFNPETLEYYEPVSNIFQLSDNEKELIKKNGFVLLKGHEKESFGTAYYHIYTNDLPVFITSDSILQSLHVSYDEMLKELEDTVFTAMFEETLGHCQSELEKYASESGKGKDDFCGDVDIFLSVALNLLAGAGAEEAGDKSKDRMDNFGDPKDQWNGQLIIPCKLGNADKVLEILKNIQTHQMQNPMISESTEIYGGKRPIDYSQFIPRGHYIESTKLKRYFRMVMWLGRADCGLFVSSSNEPAVQPDCARESRAALLILSILKKTGSMDRLDEVREILKYLVGPDDSLSPAVLDKFLVSQNMDITSILSEDKALTSFMDVNKTGLGRQAIQSQLVMSDPMSPIQADPPTVFNFFGQRFTIDSFVISKVVFDSILFKGEKQPRYKPQGLDVMAALGNQEALKLLEPDLATYNYSSNLYAVEKFIGNLPADFWDKSLYNIWLKTLQTLDKDTCQTKNIPETMKTYAWQIKQLQAQLASWAQLRHDTILYAKQPYADGTSCEYPCGYVEPYPEFFDSLSAFADQAAKVFQKAKYPVDAGRKVKKDRFGEKEIPLQEKLDGIKASQVAFLHNYSGLMKLLSGMARKELEGKPFSEEEQSMIKKTIDMEEESGGPRFNGWYCDLFYYRGWEQGTARWNHSSGGALAYKWKPEIADVYTYPDEQIALEVGTGDVGYIIIAVDSQEHRNIYVGPTYSYYEFWQPVEDRLSDEGWQTILQGDNKPGRPSWMRSATILSSDKNDSKRAPAKFDFPDVIDSNTFSKLAYLIVPEYKYGASLYELQIELQKRIFEGRIKICPDDKLCDLLANSVRPRSSLSLIVGEILCAEKNERAFGMLLANLGKIGSSDWLKKTGNIYCDDEHVDKYCQMLKENDEHRIVSKLLDLIEYSGNKRAVPHLLEFIDKYSKNNVNGDSVLQREQCMKEAISVLGKLGDQKAIGAIKQFIGKKSEEQRNPNIFTELLALCNLGDAASIELVKKMTVVDGADDENKASANARDGITILSCVKEEWAFLYLVGLLKKEDYPYKFHIVTMLKRDSRILPYLPELLEYYDGRLLVSTIEAMVELGKEKSIPIIFEKISDEDLPYEIWSDENRSSLGISFSKLSKPSYFISGLKSKNINVRRFSALTLRMLSLSRIHGSDNIKDFIEALERDYSDEIIAENMVNLIARSKDKFKVIETFKNALKNPDFDSKERAIRELTDISMPVEVAPVLIDCLDEENFSEEAITEAVHALGDWGCQQAIPKLVELLYSPSENEKIKDAVVIALEKLNPPENIWAKVYEFSSNNPNALRLLAKINIERFQDLFVFNALRFATEECYQYDEQGKREKLAEAAFEILERHCAKWALPHILQIYEKGGDNGCRAARILANFNEPQVIKALSKNFESSNQRIRMASIIALAILGQKNTRKPILDNFQKILQNPIDALFALKALSSLPPDEKTIKMLGHVLDVPSRNGDLLYLPLVDALSKWKEYPTAKSLLEKAAVSQRLPDFVKEKAKESLIIQKQ